MFGDPCEAALATLANQGFAGRALDVNQNFDATYWMLISANAQLERIDEAHRFCERFEVLVPGITVAAIRAAQANGETPAPRRHP